MADSPTAVPILISKYFHSMNPTSAAVVQHQSDLSINIGPPCSAMDAKMCCPSNG